jgi:hypothetical protein
MANASKQESEETNTRREIGNEVEYTATGYDANGNAYQY